jgi:hypothetical protein
MRMIAWHIAAATAAFAWITVAACVGEDPESTAPPAPTGTEDARGPAPGEFQGPCNATGGCVAGLVCKEGLCLHGDEGVDSGQPPIVDGGPDTARPADDCPVIGVEAGTNENPCPHASSSGTTESPCANGDSCCVGADAGENYCVTLTAACTGSGGKALRCSGTSTCLSGEVCCLEMSDAAANPKPTDSCPRSIDKTGFVSAHCATTTCPATETRICRDSTECPVNQQCHRINFDTNDGLITFGACL